VIQLPRAETVPPGMVYVPAFSAMVPLLGYGRVENLGEFCIDRTEVSNAAYAEFVEEDGYRDPSFWRDLLESDSGVALDEVAARFVDSTGRPGPAGWIDGRYRPGTANLPVTGVSWYEAMAYARYRGMTLPSARHWARAALGTAEFNWPLAPALVPAARIEASGPLPVDAGAAYSTFGAIDLVGNVQEWTHSTTPGGRKLSLGSSFANSRWQFSLPSNGDPLERLPYRGFRLAKYDEDRFEFRTFSQLPKPIIPKLSAEKYAVLMDALSYEPGTIRAREASVVSTRDEGAWIRTRVTIPTEDPGDPLPVILFVPKDASPPWQSMIFLSPGDSYAESSFHSDKVDISKYHIDFIMRSGRALVWPVVWGTHERYTYGREETREARVQYRIAAVASSTISRTIRSSTARRSVSSASVTEPVSPPRRFSRRNRASRRPCCLLRASCRAIQRTRRRC
jgi:hypothetical protein